MKITLKQEVFKKVHPKLKVHFIYAIGVDNKSQAKKANHLLAEVQKVVQLSFNKDTAKSHLLISPWNVAKQEFGKKAKHYHTSVELLLQKALRKQKLETKDTVTALLRYLALKHIVPIGADDPTKIKGDITFEVKKEDLQYRDAKKVLGRKLDYWKNAKTMLNKDSWCALIHFEFLPPVNPAKQKEIVDETVGLLQTFCGAETKVAVLDQKRNSVTFD
ncbi:MAG: hypothetical protein Q7S55_05315 [Nanoarchaeota archaeon]|nr:hypothetical protein [Nanoarchaeota archaeon]